MQTFQISEAHWFYAQGAAEKEKLHQKEYQRLNLGAVTFAAATLGVRALHWDLLRPSAALTAGAIAGLTAAAPAFYYSRTSGHGLRPGPIIQVSPHHWTDIAIT